MEKERDMEYASILIIQDMKVVLRMEKEKEEEKNFYCMELIMKEIT